MRKIEQIIGIYKITSPSGKIYIGSSKHIYRRFQYYKKLRSSGQPRIHRSLLKHGVENHTFEIVEECEFEELYNRERHYQVLYDCTGKNGLNCDLVANDEKPREASEETKKKKSVSMKGKTHTDEAKQRMSDAHTGKKLSKEHKEKLSISHSGKKLSEEHKKNIKKAHLKEDRFEFSYIQRSLKGEFICFYKTKWDIITKGYSYNGVNRHCRGERKTYKESVWERIQFKQFENE